jgi:sugar phosphate isomerase/epimerase
MPSGRKKSGKNPLPRGERYAATIPFDSIRKNLQFLKEKDLGVEVMMYDTGWVRNFPRAEVEAVGKLLQSEGIPISVHGPLFDLNPGSKDKIIRDYTKFTFMRSLNISALLGAEIVVFHLGLNPLTPRDYREEWLDVSLKTFRPVVNHAKRLGITIAIENMFLSSPNLLRKVIEKIDSPHMQVCLDVGHVNVYSTVSLAKWFDALSKYIVKIHINDNDAQNDLHLAFGEGSVDIKQAYRLLNRKKICPLMTLEMTPDQLPSTLDYIKKNKLALPSC